MAELGHHPAIQALALALVHFLWQGAVIAAVVFVSMRFVRRASLRYAIGVGALAAMLAAPAVTFMTLRVSTAAVASTIGAATAPLASAAARPLETGLAGIAPSPSGSATWQLAGVAAWLAGMLLLSLRLFGGWMVARRMATDAVRPAAAHVQALAADVARRLSLSRAVEICESTKIAVPVLVGWLRPAIVFPVAALAGLSPAQIEALIAHELAHVRRHDYLVNLLQSCAEVVLFYHPAVWWVSRRVRIDREHCCDDVAVGVCDRLVYATALTDLAAMMSPRIALAATGGDLLARVRRILEREEPSMSGKVRWMSGAVVLIGLLIAVPVLLASVRVEHKTQATRPEPPAVAESTAVPELLAESGELAAETAQTVESRAERQKLEEVRRAAEAQSREAELELARRQLERARKLFEVGLTSATQLAEAQTALALAEAGDDGEKIQALQIEAAKQRLEEAKKRVEVGLLPPDEISKIESELAKLQAGGNAQAVLLIELERAKRDLERTKMLYERGLVSADQIKETEARLAELERRLRSGELDKGKPREEADVARLVAELQTKAAESDQRRKEMVVEMEKRLVEQAQRRREIDVRLKRELDDVTARYEQTRADYERAVRDQLARRAVERRSSESLEEVAPRAIAAGDFLLVTIEGESELPTVYRIGSDGAIRIPLLGSFKVVGQTPDQVREAIGKKLSDSRLGSGSRVRVAIRRMRS